MNKELSTSIYEETKRIVEAFFAQVPLTNRELFVIGASTSEVLGEKIGSAGTEEVAAAIYKAIEEAQAQSGCHLAFQCCEHLNRALVVERETMERFGLEEVTVIPVPQAGGSMASYAYSRFKEPKMVEHVRADAGIDIGDTFIGMHLKAVAVPVRVAHNRIGSAHVTLARTRPKLIGGARAVYTLGD